MEVGFSVSRQDNVWTLKLQGTSTVGKFGTLKAAMRNAYLLANDSLGATDSDESSAGDM